MTGDKVRKIKVTVDSRGYNIVHPLLEKLVTARKQGKWNEALELFRNAIFEIRHAESTLRTLGALDYLYNAEEIFYAFKNGELLSVLFKIDAITRMIFEIASNKSRYRLYADLAHLLDRHDDIYKKLIEALDELLAEEKKDESSE